jgi:charged multivesicular body protein 7
LYSDFRHLKAINPDGYAANIAAWQKGLIDATKAGHTPSRGIINDLLILNVDEQLLQALETKEWGRPLALGTVIRDAVAKKDLISLNTFQSMKESIHRQSWTISPWQVFTWGFRYLGLAGGTSGEDKLPIGRFVVVPNLEAAANYVLRKTSEKTARVDRIYSRESFLREFSNCMDASKPLSGEDIGVLLRYLSRDKGVAAYDGETIKFKASGEKEVPPITTEDTTIVSLKALIADLTKQVDVLSDKVDKLTESAKAAVARKNKAAALAALRSKKLAETALSRRSSTLSQLEEVYTKIEQAADQIELVRVMEASTSVLNSLNSEVGGVERVDQVVDRLREQMTEVDEIGNVINEIGQDATRVDEYEIDLELEALEHQEKEASKSAESELREREEQKDAARVKERLDALPVPDQSTTDEGETTLEKSVTERTGELKSMSLDGEKSKLAEYA